MAEGQRSNQPVLPQAAQALDRFKYEVAQEVATTSNDAQAQLLHQWYQGQTGGYGGDIPSRLWGAVGGHMVRRMIAAAEQSLAQQATQSVQQGFRQAISTSFQQQPQQQQQLQPQDV